MTVSPGDHARVRELLGREPQGGYEIVVRDAAGDPVVLRNDPFLADGTPMPTRYWLIGPDEIRRIGQLEADGGVAAAEAAVDGDELATAHERYASERDAAIADGRAGPRPTGGVGGTRVGVKCLHAHWAWHLAGGDDPVGRWIAEQIAPTTMRIDLQPDVSLFALGRARHRVPWGPDNLTSSWLSDDDPPRPEALTNALGAVTDHLDDLVRDHPTALEVRHVSFAGPAVRALARLELGCDEVPDELTLRRDDAEEVFRIVATEAADRRAANPGLPSDHVGVIVATCCIVLAVMRRLHLDTVTLAGESARD